MAGPAFDAANYVRFDLDAGAIRSRDDDALVLVPPQLLGALERGDALDRAARAVGEARGKRFAAQASARGGPEPAGLPALADDLDGALAVLGLGRAEIEIRGDALLLKVRGGAAKGASPALTAFIGGLLAGYLSAVDAAMPFAVLPLGADEGGADAIAFFAGSAPAVARMQEMLAGGAAPSAAIERLHHEGGNP